MSAGTPRSTATITVLPPGSQATAIRNPQPTRLNAHTTQSPASDRISTDDVQNPSQLSQLLTRMQAAITRATTASRSNPINAGVRFQNIAVTSAVVLVLHHTMGRPWAGYFVTRSYGAPVALSDAALPNGLTATQAIALTPSATGTIDIWVF